MKRKLAFICILCCMAVGFAQNKVETLKTELANAKTDSVKLKVYTDLLWALLDYEYTQDAEPYMLKLKELSTRLNNYRYIGNYYLLEGRAAQLKEEYLSAIESYGKAAEAFKKADLRLGLERSYDNIANCYEKFGKHELALKNYLLRLEEAKRDTDQVNLMKAYAKVGKAYTSIGKYSEAHEAYLNSLKISERINNTLNQFFAYNNLSLLYKIQKKFDEAKNYNQKALDVVTRSKDSLYIAGALFNFGALYHEMKDFKKAIEYNTMSMEVSRLMGDEGSVTDCLVNEGSMYQAMGDEEKALEDYKKAYEIYQRIEHKEGLISLGLNMAVLLSKKNDMKGALRYLNDAAELVAQLNLIEQRKELYMSSAEVYSNCKDYKNALYYTNLFNAVKDSLVNSNNRDNFLKQQMGFEFDKKEAILKAENEKIMAVSAEEKQRRNMIIAFISVGFLFLVMITALIYRNLVNNKSKNKLISEQKELLEEKQKDITDSINYALRIQKAILPPIEFPQMDFGDSFILFKPKDIVSGDFYWYIQKNGKKIVAATDCTGHGVPGAFMSMLGMTFLNEIVNEKGITTPSEILGSLRDKIKATLKQQGAEGENKDGMDIALISIDEKNETLEFAGANNPLWIYRNENNETKYIELAPDKRPIGYFKGMGLPFTNTSFKLKKDDRIFIFTDGFADQFGGPRGKKFKYKQLSDLLLSLHGKSMRTHQEILNSTFEEWKGNLEQVDDVCVIGVKI